MRQNDIQEKLCGLLAFFEKAGKLKKTERFTATLRANRESTAEHSWRLSLMVLLIAHDLKLDLDIAHAVNIAIIHDLAESVTGDIDAYDMMQGIMTQKQKNINEKKALQQLTKGFSFGSKITSLWQEYLEQKSPEARFVKALDKIESFLYLAEQGPMMYAQPEFHANYADAAVNNFPQLSAMLNLVKKKIKRKFCKGEIVWKE